MEDFNGRFHLGSVRIPCDPLSSASVEVVCVQSGHPAAASGVELLLVLQEVSKLVSPATQAPDSYKSFLASVNTCLKKNRTKKALLGFLAEKGCGNALFV